MFDIEDVTEAIQTRRIGRNATVTAAFRATGLPEPVLTVDPATVDLPLPRQIALLDWWEGLTRPNGLPHHRSIDPITLRPLLGDLVVLQVLDGGKDFRYRLFGSHLSTAIRIDFTNQLVSEVKYPGADVEAIRAFFLVSYRLAMRLRCPVYTRHQPPLTITPFHWHRLIFPFVADDGVIDRIVVQNLQSLDG